MSEEHLFEDNVVDVTENSLKTLAEFCTNYKDLETEIEDLEDKLKEKKKELENVSRVQIPDLLNQYKLSEIKLSTGEKVIVEDKLKPSIADKNYLLAYRNMVKGELPEKEEDQTEEEKALATSRIDDLFKAQIVIADFEDEDTILDLLLDNDVPYESKKSVHHQTLKKYCAGRLDHGKEIPEGISVFQYQETKIK